MANFSSLSEEELIHFRIEVDKELNRRGIRFTVGEIGEKIAIRYFNSNSGLSNLMAAPTGAKNVDALSREGDRYSIKTVQKSKKTGTIYPDPTLKEKQLFEFLLIVQLDGEYNLMGLYRFSWEQFKKVVAWDKRMNAWYVPISKSRLSQGEFIYHKQ